MMIKLYKKVGDQFHYWEAWNRGGDIVIHRGRVGERGETEAVPLPHGATAEDSIESLAIQSRSQGYVEADEEEPFWITITYKLTTAWGAVEDLERRHKIEELLNEELGWTGNGMCDGGDIGSYEMCIACIAIDYQIAVQSILSVLKNIDALSGATIAVRRSDDDDEIVVWPERQ